MKTIYWGHNTALLSLFVLVMNSNIAAPFWMLTALIYFYGFLTEEKIEALCLSLLSFYLFFITYSKFLNYI